MDYAGDVGAASFKQKLRKPFFFEKKNQKTFTLGAPQAAPCSFPKEATRRARMCAGSGRTGRPAAATSLPGRQVQSLK
jgi:hypothetical protein